MQTGLISQALVIGSVNAAVYWTDEGLRALRMEPMGGYVDCSRQASLLLDCPAEKRWVVNINRAQLEASVALWSQRQRLLNWLIAGLDGDLSDETRRLGLELAEESWNAEISAFVRARLLGCPLPDEADIQGVFKLADGLPHCHQLYCDLFGAAQYIQPVSRQLQEWVYYDYIGDTPPDETYRTLLDHGIIAETVTLLAQGNAAGLDKLVMQFSDVHALREVCPRLPDMLTAWVGWLKKEYADSFKKTDSTPHKLKVIHVPPSEDTILIAQQKFVVNFRNRVGSHHKKLNINDHPLGSELFLIQKLLTMILWIIKTKETIWGYFKDSVKVSK
jgi:hypothetical protein